MAELLLGSRIRLRIGSEIFSSPLRFYAATKPDRLSDVPYAPVLARFAAFDRFEFSVFRHVGHWAFIENGVRCFGLLAQYCMPGGAGGLEVSIGGGGWAVSTAAACS